MSTLRCRLPILLSECISRRIDIRFEVNFAEPVLCWGNRETKNGGHHHLDNWIPGQHGHNALEIEAALEHILEIDERDRKEGADE